MDVIKSLSMNAKWLWRDLLWNDIAVEIPLLGGTVRLTTNRVQRVAAWNMYIELKTRIALVTLNNDEGLMREALSSLYKVFQETRKILREYGPVLARGQRPFSPIAITVLNDHLRPFLAKWHPLLSDWEEQRPTDTTQYQHEQAWEYRQTFRGELAKLQTALLDYADALAKIAGSPTSPDASLPK